jgi:hypothetical protein
MSPSDFEIAGNAQTLFEIAGIPTIAGIFASLNTQSKSIVIS